MCEIVELRLLGERKTKSEQSFDRAHTAEIVMFTGVQYEKMADEELDHAANGTFNLSAHRVRVKMVNGPRLLKS